jgi:hypothetical protein
MRLMQKCFASTALAAMLALCAAPAHAGMVLTAAGTGLGFTLSTFADSFPTTGICCGPLGIAFPGSGGVLVSDYPGNMYLFPTDTDGQHAFNVTPVTGYGSNNPTGLATLGGKVYMAEQAVGEVVQLNDNGTFNQNIDPLTLATGTAGDEANGLLYVSNVSTRIYAINPLTKSINLFESGEFDGLTLDATNQILYAEGSGQILGYRISDGALVFASGGVPDGPDGAAIGTGSLAGNIFVNTNGGTLYEINLTTKVQTLIASGGSRGDFVTVDPNGTLLLTQTDSILRLTPPNGGGFGNAPEPASALLTMGGLSGLVLALRKLKARA